MAVRLVLLAALLGCACAERWSAPPPGTSHAAPEEPREEVEPAPTADDPTLEPEQEPAHAERFVELPLQRGEPAVVSVADTRDGPRPVLVATHGAGGTPIAHCAMWRTVVGTRAFVLCPTGVRMYGTVDAFFYDGHIELGKEVGLALAALAQRFGDDVDMRAPIYAGYSQGAGMGSLMLPTHAAGFSRAVLIEGGYGAAQEWNVASARRFRERGGLRVVLACGRPRCRDQAKVTASYMERAGLEARVVFANVGHTYGGELYEKVREAFVWLVEGDPRW
jgi:predicted esterase